MKKRTAPEPLLQSSRTGALQTMAGAGEGEGMTREFGVDQMTCGKCESRVTQALKTLGGVSWVQINLQDKTVQAHGSASSDEMIEVLTAAGYPARLIGTGTFSMVPPEVGPAAENAAVVAEYKGPDYGHGLVHGVVRIFQKSADRAEVEATLGGLKPGAPHTIAVHKSGDLSGGAAGVGGVYEGDGPKEGGGKVGELCSAAADKEGVMRCRGPADLLRVWEIIGRSCVVHEGSVADGSRLAASVLARSAGVGTNHKMVCSCDGTKLWEAQNVA